MAFLERLLHETGLYSLYCSGNRDIYLILLTRFLRMFAYGGVALVLGIFLWVNDHKDRIGTFMSLTLLGDALISYVLTLIADRFGRRRILLVGSLLMIPAGIVFVFSTNYYLLLLAAIVGVMSPGAHEIGPFRAIEESVLAHLTTLDVRTDIYAWFAISSTLGMSLGLAVAGWTTYLLSHNFGWDWKKTYPVIFGVYAGIGLIKAGMIFFLTEACEAELVPVEESTSTSERTNLLNNTFAKKQPTSTIRRIRKTVSLPTRVSRESRPILVKLCFLFAINSFASGMLPVTLMSWYANYRFRWWLTNRIGYAMAAIWLVSSASNLASASAARRFGLVPTMVITHLPAAIFVAFVPLATTWYVMLILLLLVSAFGSTDQAPRAAFVAACFKRNERTTVIGTLNLVKTVAAAGGPLVSSFFWNKKIWWPVFVIAAVVKVLYDVGLMVMFLRTTLPEEKAGKGGAMGEVRVNDVDVGILLGDRVFVGDGEGGLPGPEEFEDYDDDGDTLRDDYGEGSSGDEDSGARRQMHGKVMYTV